jgi:hypothetical protein
VVVSDGPVALTIVNTSTRKIAGPNSVVKQIAVCFSASLTILHTSLGVERLILSVLFGIARHKIKSTPPSDRARALTDSGISGVQTLWAAQAECLAV